MPLRSNDRFGRVRLNRLEVVGELLLEPGAKITVRSDGDGEDTVFSRDELVGASVETDEGAQAEVTPFDAPDVPDSEATTVKQLVADHNALLAALRGAGILASDEPEPSADETPEAADATPDAADETAEPADGTEPAPAETPDAATEGDVETGAADTPAS